MSSPIVKQRSGVRVGISCSQNWKDFPADNSQYLNFLVAEPEMVQQHSLDCLVIAGGYTEPRQSEAEMAMRVFESHKAWPFQTSCIARDHVSLCSRENLEYGLMAARLLLGHTPIREVHVYALWLCK